MNKNDEAIKAAQLLIDFCKNKICQNCIFWLDDQYCGMKYLPSSNWQSNPTEILNLVIKRKEEIEDELNPGFSKST